MTTSARRLGRPALPPEVRGDADFLIGMRVSPAEHQRCREHAEREERSMSSFARRIYLKGLAQYEAELARSGAAASAVQHF